MSLSLSMLGAADTVTGSKTLLSYRGQKWLVDCGLFQGPKDIRQRNWETFSPDPRTLSGVLLTHAHLDHCGFLPRLVREGFSGRIHGTIATKELAAIVLRDAAWLEEESAHYANKSGYSHHKPALPLFTQDDAEKAISHFEGHPRHEWIPLGEGISFRFLRAGHIPGASLVQVHVMTTKGPRLMTFSGDLGNHRSLVMRGPEPLLETDLLVLESTYGSRLQSRRDGLESMAEIARRTFARQGVLVIPAFAIGRAMEIVYMFRTLEDRGMIPAVPIILDSPMATAALSVGLRHTEDHGLDSAFLGQKDQLEAFKPKYFELSSSADESLAACMRDGPMVIVSASGMLSGGRILHHLKARLPHEKNTMIFAGYQAEGSKGRWLQDFAMGKQEGKLRIHHKEVEVEAEIVTMDELSAHADYQDMMEWLRGLKKAPELTIVNHGSEESQKALRDRIKKELGWHVVTAFEQRHTSIWDDKFAKS